MIKTGYRILAQIVDDSESLAGYMLYHVPSGMKKLATELNTLKFIQEKGCDNAEVVGGKIKGTESSLDRLPKYDMSGRLLNEGRLVVLGIAYEGDKEQSIELLDGLGRVVVLAWLDGLALLNKVGAVNAKLVGKGNGVYLSAIVGSLNKIDVEKKVEEKKVVEKKVTAKRNETPLEYFDIEGTELKKFYLKGKNNTLPVVDDVVIPNGITVIGESAFEDCGIKSVVIPDSVTSIDKDAFRSNELTSVVIGNSVTSIENCAFWGNKLNRIVIPNSVISIGSHAFYDNNLTSVVIPDSVKSIGEYAFTDNRPDSIILPDNVKLHDEALGHPVEYQGKGTYELKDKKFIKVR